MKFQKGESGNLNGRPQGAKGKIQTDIKQAFQSLVEGNLMNIETWLNEVAAKDPAKALDLILKLSEFVLPKIKSVQLDAKINEPFTIVYQDVSGMTREEIESLENR